MYINTAKLKSCSIVPFFVNENTDQLSNSPAFSWLVAILWDPLWLVFSSTYRKHLGDKFSFYVGAMPASDCSFPKAWSSLRFCYHEELSQDHHALSQDRRFKHFAARFMVISLCHKQPNQLCGNHLCFLLGGKKKKHF